MTRFRAVMAAILFCMGCQQRAALKPPVGEVSKIQTGEAAGNAVSEKAAQSNDADDQTATVKELRAQFLLLSDQLSGQTDKDSKDLALLAKAVGNASDAEVGAYLDSGYAEETADDIDALSPSHTPPLFGNTKHRVAAAMLITLGVVEIGAAGVVAAATGNGHAAGLVIALSLAAFGTVDGLLEDHPSEETISGAKMQLIGGSCVALIAGLASIGYRRHMRQTTAKTLAAARTLIVEALAAQGVGQSYKDWAEGIKSVEANRRLSEPERKLFVAIMTDLQLEAGLQEQRAGAKTIVEMAKQYKIEEAPLSAEGLLAMPVKDAESLYRKLALKTHPDRGGKAEDSIKLTEAKGQFDRHKDVEILKKQAPTENFIRSQEPFFAKHAFGAGAMLFAASSALVAYAGFDLTGGASNPKATLATINDLILKYRRSPA